MCLTSLCLRSLLFSMLAFAGGICAEENPMEADQAADGLANKIAADRWWGVATIVSYGVIQWDYFSRPPHRASEGWFGADTPEGGADKWGHAYSTHLMTHTLAARYREFGLTQQDAGKQALLSSLLLNGVMEVGDSFSNYGYSNEDMIMNVVGAYIGYKTVVDDVWRDRLDFRIEHNLRGASRDPFTDYQHYKYLFALKLNGFDSLADTPLRWLEFHIGYYARGYHRDDALRERHAYIGVGFNFGLWFEKQGWHRTATVLRFVQPPATSLVNDVPEADK